MHTTPVGPREFSFSKTAHTCCETHQGIGIPSLG